MISLSHKYTSPHHSNHKIVIFDFSDDHAASLSRPGGQPPKLQWANATICSFQPAATATITSSWWEMDQY